MFGSLASLESDLLRQFDQLAREMESLFAPLRGISDIRAVGRGAFPAVNVGVTPEAVEVYVFVPGVDPNALEVSLQDNLLVVSGERQLDYLDKENVSFYLRERFAGEFRRAISLPEDIDPERVEATYTNGILRIRVHKREAVKPRHIEVKTG
ncbi:MAG TPA: Hsp20/alpha crystallin family protein [Methylothermaceae bacterium]|nr:Hsp20/alpha crystallin family protein [Methylothermaceae bacterium]